METVKTIVKAQIFNYFMGGFGYQIEESKNFVDILIRKVLYRGTKKLPDGKKIPELQNRLPGGCCHPKDILNSVTELCQKTIKSSQMGIMDGKNRLQGMQKELEVLFCFFTEDLKKAPKNKQDEIIYKYNYNSEKIVFKWLQANDISAVEELPPLGREIFELSKLKTLKREIEMETGCNYEKAIETNIKLKCRDGHQRFWLLLKNLNGPDVFIGSADSDIERSEWVSLNIFKEIIWKGHSIQLEQLLSALCLKFLGEKRIRLAKIINAEIDA